MTTTAPTPWARSTVSTSGIEPYIIRDANGYAVADCRHFHSHSSPADNLDLITRAVNGYAFMLNELQETLRDLEQWDGSEEAMEIMQENLRAAIFRVRSPEAPKPAEPPQRPRIVVTVDGGLVQTISQQGITAGSVEVITIDYDTEGTSDDVSTAGGEPAIITAWTMDDLLPSISKDIDLAFTDHAA